MKKYKIGEVAKLLDSTTQTLRFYEQEGVITPQKSQNGTRYYTESDIIRLIAFKRFQLMDFTVRDVAEHFRRGRLDTLLTRMEDTSAHLRAESDNLLRRAHAIDQFEAMLRLAQENIGVLACVSRPRVYMHECTLAELEAVKGKKRESFDLFMNAMPEAHVCFLYQPSASDALHFHMAITEKGARTWQLPLEDTLSIPEGPCVRLIVRTDARLWQPIYLNEQIDRVSAAGYTVDETLPVIGQQLVSESDGKQGYLLAALYVPIKFSQIP